MTARLRGHRLELTAFIGLAALVAWRYAGVETHPPIARVTVFVALGVAAAAAMITIRSRRPSLLRAGALAGFLVLALPVAGVPVRLLVPNRWGTLAARLGGGLDAVASTLWPYSGGDGRTRTDLMLVLGAGLVLAAGLAFWPARVGARCGPVRARARRLVALGLLLTVYVLGLLDSDGGSVPIEGVLLLALIAAWLWPAGPGRIHGRRTGAAMAWLAGAGAVAAVLAAQLTGAQAWLGYRGWNLLGTGDHGVAFAWDQTYGPLHWSRSERPMFTAGTSQAELWKTTTLDRFDGLHFIRSAAAAAAPGDQDLPLPLNNSWYRFVRFTISGLQSHLLPAPQGVTAGVRTRIPIDYAPDGTVAARRDALPAGTTYTVLSYVPEPRPAELRSAPPTIPAGYRRYTEFALPGPRLGGTVTTSPYAPMYRLARRLARGRRTRYEVAVAIERYLKNNEAYDEQVPVRRYPLEAFLFTDHIGYCQQFSGAMALMLRMNGIPARIAAGFRPGVYDAPNRQWVVRAVDAHSWVEVYFSGIGWVPFDPTPPRVDTVQQRAVFPSRRAPQVNQLQALAATIGSAPRPPAPVRASRPAGNGIGPLLAAAAALLALLLMGGRWLTGTIRLRRSLSGDGELAGRELVHGLRRLGYELPASVTLARIEAVVRMHGGPDAARYVRYLRDRNYAAGRSAPPTLADRRRLRRGLTQRLGLSDRIRGLRALPPGTLGGGVTADHPGGP